MPDTELSQLRKRIRQLESEAEHCRRREQFLEANEANLQLFARSLAHDLNNLVAAMLGHASLLAAAAEPGSEVHDSANIIQRAAERSIDLISQLLQFTRGGLGQSVPVDLHEAIREVADLLRRTIDPDIRIVLNLEAANADILGDPGQIHQLLLNLAINARDAMPNGGELIFATSVLPGFDHLMVAIKDTGIGIPADIQKHIFEPFFTTKSSHEGTGMGLAIVKRVVENHSGSVEVRSGEGEDKGAEFRIFLPLREPRSANGKAMAATVN